MQLQQDNDSLIGVQPWPNCARMPGKREERTRKSLAGVQVLTAMLACADAYAEASSIVSESLGSVRTVLAFNAAERTAEEYDDVSSRLRASSEMPVWILPRCTGRQAT